jgi:hypothetical protein
VTTTTRRILQLTLSMVITLITAAGVQVGAGALPLRTTGTPGTAAQHTSINLKAIAHEVAYGPMPLNEQRTIHRPLAPRSESFNESPAKTVSESDTLAPTAAASTAQSLTPVGSFAAVADNGTVIPPDTEGAVDLTI